MKDGPGRPRTREGVKTSLYLPEEIKKTLKVIAAKNETTMQALILEAIKKTYKL